MSYVKAILRNLICILMRHLHLDDVFIHYNASENKEDKKFDTVLLWTTAFSDHFEYIFKTFPYCRKIYS